MTRPRRAAWLFVIVVTAWATVDLPWLPREPEHPLPHDAALALVGASAHRGLHRVHPLLLEHTVDWRIRVVELAVRTLHADGKVTELLDIARVCKLHDRGFRSGPPPLR